MSHKLRVLIVAPSMRNFGGQSLQAKNLLESLSQDDEVEVEFLENDPQTLFDQIKYLRTFSKSLKFLARLLRKVPTANLVHVFSAGMSGYVIATLPPLFVSRLFLKPVLLHYHSGELEEHIKKWRLTALPTMKKFDKIVVPSKYLAEIFACYGLESTIIPNFIDLERFKFRERNPLRPVFLSNRNFEAHYNVSDVLRAFSLIVQEFSEAKLYVVGYGQEEIRLKDLASELQLDSVEFVGKVTNEEMISYYDKADIFLNASLVDNMPLSFIEAFACGLPVVSYATGGIVHIVENERSGLLVEKGDYEALAKQAIRLVKEKELAQQIIRNARKTVAEFDPKQAIKKWKQVYLELKN